MRLYMDKRLTESKLKLLGFAFHDLTDEQRIRVTEVVEAAYREGVRDGAENAGGVGSGVGAGPVVVDTVGRVEEEVYYHSGSRFGKTASGANEVLRRMASEALRVGSPQMAAVPSLGIKVTVERAHERMAPGTDVMP